MIVLKFGGALLDSLDGAGRVIRQIARVDTDALIVVSAFGGMTNRFERLAETAVGDPELATRMLDEIVGDHRHIAEGLLADATLADWQAEVGLLPAKVAPDEQVKAFVSLK